MVFDRIWHGATDFFDDAVDTVVDILDSPEARMMSLGGSGVIGVGILNMPDPMARQAFSFFQEDIFGMPSDTEMAAAAAGGFAPEPSGGLIPSIAGKVASAYDTVTPDWLSEPSKRVLTPVLDAWQWSIDELVDRPLGTFFTVMHDADFNGRSRMFDISAWQRAYEINDDQRTFGQSFAYSFMGVDPYDEDEYNAIRSDPVFNLLSGGADLVQELLDPVSYFTGGLGRVARGANVVRLPGGRVLGRTRPARAPIPGVTRIPQPVQKVVGLGVRDRAGTRRQTIQNVTQARSQAFAGTNYTNPTAGRLPHRTYQQLEDVVGKLDNWQDRAAAFNAVLGKAARNMDEKAIEIFARAETPAARQLSMRVLTGDFSAIDEMGEIAQEMLSLQHSKEFFVDAGSNVDDFINSVKQFDEGRMTTGDARFPIIARYKELQSSVNWFQMYDMQQTLYKTQQRGFRVNPNTGIYEIDDASRVTLNSMDQGLFINALEETLGSEFGRTAHFSYQLSMIGSVAEIPFGGRLRTLLHRQSKILDETGQDVVLSEWVNTNNLFSGLKGPQGRVMRVLSERVAQATANSQDPNFLEQMARMLDAARRVRVVGKKQSGKDKSVWKGKKKGGTRLTDEAEVALISAEFTRLHSLKDYARLDEFFDEVVERFNSRLDDMLDNAEFSGIDTLSRSSLGSDYKRQLAEHQESSKTAVSIQAGSETADEITVTRQVGDDGADTLINHRKSPSQVQMSRPLPRYDVVQRRVNRMETFGRKYDKAVADGKVLKSVFNVNDKAHSAWRGSMLLTPKWPVRVGIDEQLRMMIVMGSMVTVRRSVQGYQDLRRELATRNLKDIETVGDVTLIGRELADIMDVPLPKRGETFDYYELLDAATDRQFKAAVRRVRNRAILQKKNVAKILRNSMIKGGLFGLAFGADITMGAGYFGYSLLSRHQRIVTQTRRSANLNYAAVLRRQAQASLIRAAGDPAAIRAARSKMTDADFIEALAKEVPEAKTALNQFEAAERLMEKAGFPSLNIGGVKVRNAFGDDPNYVEQWRGFVSASKARDSLLSGAHRAANRQLEEFGTTAWSVFDVLEMGSDPAFAQKWSRMMDLYTGDAIANEFYEIVWTNTGTAVERAERLVELMRRNPKVWNDLYAPQHIDDYSDEDLFRAAENVIFEYDNVLPPELFPGLRERAMTGKVEWPEVRAALDDLTETLMPLEAGEKITRNTVIQRIREGDLGEGAFLTAGEAAAPAYPYFGRSLGPDPMSHNNLGKAQEGKNLASQYIRDHIYPILGTLPTDNLARMPFFRANYEIEVARRIETLPFDDNGKVLISQRQLKEMEDGARKHALKETRTILYDLAENLRISEIMGNSVAFLNAYAEVFSRWAGFALRQPAEVLGKYRLYEKEWSAEALGLIEIEDPESGARYLMLNLVGEDASIINALPKSIRDQIIPPFLQDMETPMRFSKDGLNTALQGTMPGFGPLITTAVREVALRQNPELEEVLGFMYPFGHPDSSMGGWAGVAERFIGGSLPAYQKAIYNAINQNSVDNDEVTGRMMKDIYTQRKLDGNPIDMGDPEEVQAWINEAQNRTRQFNMFRAFQGLLSPTSTTLVSPYHELIEEARALQREHGQREGTRRFLDEHGMDFFALAQRMTRLNDGTAASLKSELLYEENKALVQAYPEIGAWITGSIGGSGEEYMFSSHVYWRQKNMRLNEGSREQRRTVMSPQEFAESMSVSEGWTRFFELQEWERIERGKIYAAGLEDPNIVITYENGVSGNPIQMLKDYKASQIRALESEFPDWSNEYNNFGSSAATMKNVNRGFGAVLQNERLSNRPSADFILQYYGLRYAAQLELQKRKDLGGSDNIEARENADLLAWWRSTKEKIGDTPGFSHVYDRFFERDRLLSQTFIDPDDFGGLLELEVQELQSGY